jgi:hypothetical protein
MKLFDLFKKKTSTIEQENIKEPEPETLKYVDVIFPDGHIEQYHPNFCIEDGINCIVCSGAEYHYHKYFYCKYLIEEMAKDKTVKAFTVKEAEEQGKTYCPECHRQDLLQIEVDSFDL